jgi:hypothetical protein
MSGSRLSDIKRFYSIIDLLEKKNSHKKFLSNSNGRQKWIQRGVYFFFENNQMRIDSGDGLRVTRVGTHALKEGSKTTLWRRLAQHKGTVKNNGGNHRGSIFRTLIGTALINKYTLNSSTWGQRNSNSKDTRSSELELEQCVSKTIRQMPFLCLLINDVASKESLRGYIERNSIALLSNSNKKPLDAASEEWLGHNCNRERVKKSHLWNQNHVDDIYDLDFLNVFEELVFKM